MEGKSSKASPVARSAMEDVLAKGDGAGNRIRTDDLRITNASLYQLSYPGKVLFINPLCMNLQSVV